MRYSVFIDHFLRQSFSHERLSEAIDFAARNNGYVFDWWNWRRVELPAWKVMARA